MIRPTNMTTPIMIEQYEQKRKPFHCRRLQTLPIAASLPIPIRGRATSTSPSERGPPSTLLRPSTCSRLLLRPTMGKFSYMTGIGLHYSEKTHGSNLIHLFQVHLYAPWSVLPASLSVSADAPAVSGGSDDGTATSPAGQRCPLVSVNTETRDNFRRSATVQPKPSF